MAFRFDPPQSTQYQVQRLAVDRIDNALEHLSKIGSASDAADAIAHVHAVRRRCKQARALARLVRPALGNDFAPFNTAVRDAARALSPLRNAHVSEQLLQALDTTSTTATRESKANTDTTSVGLAVDTARNQLRLARGLIEGWHLPDGFGALASGLERTYRRGRRGLRNTHADPTAETLHEWRKDVKDLWYQLRLIERIAPSMLDPFIDQLELLGEELGQHHDITLLIEGLAIERRHLIKQQRKNRTADLPNADPTSADLTSADLTSARTLTDIELAADRADDALHHLGLSARRLGDTIYAEAPASFVARLGAYWTITARSGLEPLPKPRTRATDRKLK